MLVNFLENLSVEDQQRYPCRVEEEQKEAWRFMAEQLRQKNKEDKAKDKVVAEADMRKKKKKKGQ